MLLVFNTVLSMYEINDIYCYHALPLYNKTLFDLYMRSIWCILMCNKKNPFHFRFAVVRFDIANQREVNFLERLAQNEKVDSIMMVNLYYIV